MAGYSLDILSASWGPTDVSNTVRDLYKSQAKPGTSVFAFTPSNSIFGDPMPGQPKVFVMVWRVLLSPSSSPTGPYGIYSTAQTVRVSEGGTMNLDYSQGLIPYTPQVNPPNNLIIYSASYNTMDVTGIVISLNTTAPLNVLASNETFHGDPAPGKTKQCSITYAYVRDDGFLDYNMKAVVEHQTIVIPKGPAPRLTIHAANFGGADVTTLVRNAVTFDQTFTTTSSTWPPGLSTDPWSGVRKVFSIMYQYGSGPLELMVALEKTGVQVIAPFQAARRSYFNNNAGEYAGNTNILSIVWGDMQNHPDPVSSSIFTAVASSYSLACNNSTFGFDGLVGEGKTGLVFYQYGLSGAIQCAVARENTTLYLNPRNSSSSDPLSGRGLLRTTEWVNGFYLRPVATSGAYVAMTANGLSATAVTRADAALFHFVSANGAQPQALQVTAGGVTKYVKLGPNSQITLVGTQAEASRFDYELLARTSSLAVLLGLSVTDVSAPPSVMMISDGSTSVITMPFAAMDNPTCCYFGFEWNVVSQDESVMKAKEAELDTIDPCTFAFITIIKDWTIDLLSVLGNFHYFQTQGSKVTAIFLKWWQSLDTGVAGKIAQLLTSLIAAGQKFTSAVTELLGSGVILLQYMWDVGAFWTLISSFLSDVGWWDVLVFTSSILLTIAETINPTSMAIKIIGLGVWVGTVVHDLIGGYNACAPGVTAAVRKNLLALHGTVRIITSHNAFLRLGSKNQALAVNNLLEPHYRRVLGGDKLWPPAIKVPEREGDNEDGNIKLLTFHNAEVDSAVSVMTEDFEAELKAANKRLEKEGDE
ncbi:hypothetical protein OIDMADRAFT_56909 [Oidiodendron maius Zn]|uniref:Uncharacterized protein n=1 Tax=Oidiodendron maius (strain Zn) TaxID=913774 RepID=A0A0C3GR98_OIDMZ|nr:hypothetical protein OIDMADRAFT_56909 [Oidiodendron maius Zn]